MIAIESPQILAEQLARLEIQTARKAAKLEKKLNALIATPAKVPSAPLPRFKARKWINLDEISNEDKIKVSILTWNMLAQSLVKRDLFPGSDLLKSKERVPVLMEEVLHYDADIVCLQEVDRLEDHLPKLEKHYECSSFIGYENKNHGLLIAWKPELFTKVGESSGRLDEMSCQVVGGTSKAESGLSSRAEIGLSRSTRNVFNFVALEKKDTEGKGIIVGTTHLFWHPRHSYERARQTGILFQAARTFKASKPEYESYEVLIAGDFNSQPNDIAYLLLQPSAPLSLSQLADLQYSAVVHHSVDKFYDPDYITPPDPPTLASQDPDKVIRNSRPSTALDGLLNLEGLRKLYSNEPAISAYGSRSLDSSVFDGLRYGDRNAAVANANVKIEETVAEISRRSEGTLEERKRRGDGEPIWTNFTPLWRCTLDYIFLLPNPNSTAQFTGLLELHATSAMEPGLPRKGIEPSDHIAIGAILKF